MKTASDLNSLVLRGQSRALSSFENVEKLLDTLEYYWRAPSCGCTSLRRKYVGLRNTGVSGVGALYLENMCRYPRRLITTADDVSYESGIDMSAPVDLCAREEPVHDLYMHFDLAELGHTTYLHVGNRDLALIKKAHDNLRYEEGWERCIKDVDRNYPTAWRGSLPVSLRWGPRNTEVSAKESLVAGGIRLAYQTLPMSATSSDD